MTAFGPRLSRKRLAFSPNAIAASQESEWVENLFLTNSFTSGLMAGPQRTTTHMIPLP
jgi:hypothetical protein